MPDIFTAPPSAPVAPAPEVQKTPLFSQAFSSFLIRPQGMHFQTQSGNEIIILFLRRHPITNVPWIIITGLLALALPAVFAIFPGTMLPLFQSSPMVIITIIFIWYLFTATYALVQFLLWYFTVSVVTNHRIIDIDFTNILYKEFSATTIEKVEDVTDRRGGFFGVLFNFGDVLIQTAAASEVFEFLSVPHPDEVVRIINELMGQKKGGHKH